MAEQRKRYSAHDKIELLRLHLLEQVPVPVICERHKIHPTIFYRWQRQLFSRGHLGFQGRSSARLLANYRRKLTALKIAARVRDEELRRAKQQLKQHESLLTSLQKFAAAPARDVAYSLTHAEAASRGNLNRTDAGDESNSATDVSANPTVTKLSLGIKQPAQIETGRSS